MMYCKNCGREITNSAKFCPYCGAQINPFAEEKSSEQAKQFYSNGGRVYNSPEMNKIKDAAEAVCAKIKHAKDETDAKIDREVQDYGPAGHSAQSYMRFFLRTGKYGLRKRGCPAFFYGLITASIAIFFILASFGQESGLLFLGAPIVVALSFLLLRMSCSKWSFGILEKIMGAREIVSTEDQDVISDLNLLALKYLHDQGIPVRSDIQIKTSTRAGSFIMPASMDTIVMSADLLPSSQTDPENRDACFALIVCGLMKAYYHIYVGDPIIVNQVFTGNIFSIPLMIALSLIVRESGDVYVTPIFHDVVDDRSDMHFLGNCLLVLTLVFALVSCQTVKDYLEESHYKADELIVKANKDMAVVHCSYVENEKNCFSFINFPWLMYKTHPQEDKRIVRMKNMGVEY